MHQESTIRMHAPEKYPGTCQSHMAEWQTKFKAEDDSFLDMLHREYGSGV